MYWSSLMNVFALSAPAGSQVKQAFVLFEAFAVLMGVFVLVITIMVIRRWIRRRHKDLERTPTNMPDPWKEAGKRIKPYDRS